MKPCGTFWKDENENQNNRIGEGSTSYGSGSPIVEEVADDRQDQPPDSLNNSH